MFRRRTEIRHQVSITVDGQPVVVAAGDSVAAALLLASDEAYRLTAISGRARAPFCLIGNCFDCLVEIDGVPNRQGCLTAVRDGMAVRRQRGKVRIEP